MNMRDIPFILNWSGGANTKAMQVNDDAVMTALVEILGCFEELQPNIIGKNKTSCSVQL